MRTRIFLLGLTIVALAGGAGVAGAQTESQSVPSGGTFQMPIGKDIRDTGPREEAPAPRRPRARTTTGPAGQFEMPKGKDIRDARPREEAPAPRRITRDRKGGAAKSGKSERSAKDFAPGQKQKTGAGSAKDFAPGRSTERGEPARDAAPGQLRQDTTGNSTGSPARGAPSGGAMGGSSGGTGGSSGGGMAR